MIRAGSPCTHRPCCDRCSRDLPSLVRAVLGLQERQHELRFHLIRTVHDDGRSWYRRRLRAEPVVSVVRTKRPQQYTSG